jgi:hypothetical protein
LVDQTLHTDYPVLSRHDAAYRNATRLLRVVVENSRSAGSTTEFCHPWRSAGDRPPINPTYRILRTTNNLTTSQQKCDTRLLEPCDAESGYGVRQLQVSAFSWLLNSPAVFWTSSTRHTPLISRNDVPSSVLPCNCLASARCV